MTQSSDVGVLLGILNLFGEEPNVEDREAYSLNAHLSSR